jgi:Probable cobalt transporter subunit (CbtA)
MSRLQQAVRDSASLQLRMIAMTTGSLLWRGMIVGFVAALLSFGILKVVGEPAVDRAIAFESAMDEAKAKAEHDAAVAKGETPPPPEEDYEIVSRPTQAGIGLFTGVTTYSVAFGGMFSLAFAICYGRMGNWSPRVTSALIALSGFLAVYAVPILKYPANPPSIGNPDTIGLRTAVYFGMILLSLGSMIAVWSVRNRLMDQLGAWNATIVAALAFLVAVVIFALVMPSLDEVPEGFPAVVLWQFRMASLGAQAIMWTVLGLGFGAWVEHDFAQAKVGRLQTAY